MSDPETVGPEDHRTPGEQHTDALAQLLAAKNAKHAAFIEAVHQQAVHQPDEEES